MKLLVIVVLGPLIGLAGVLGAIAQTQPESDVQGSQILERAIAAAGGGQAWKGVKDFRASGTLSLYSSGEVVDSENATLARRGVEEVSFIGNAQP